MIKMCYWLLEKRITVRNEDYRYGDVLLYVIPGTVSNVKKR